MDLKNLILLLIDEFGGKISSKTKIHKLCYLYSIIYKKDFGYKPHYYGPYSPKVENALDELKGIGLLDVNEQSFGINHEGFEVIRYDYSINRFSQEVLNKIRISDLVEIKEIKNFVSKLKEIGDPDYFELSIAAKAFYILNKEGKPLTSTSIIDKAKEFDWHITENALNNAIELLVKLGLVERKGE